ncbi:hypothetical protein TIFTF001_016794 [Ficus carica]|uniref:FHA domain-containing protein n=1 Tax=Ficus carica TaxID=3494 RepID=A0AA88D933_FICCA|nr:hypothetical protein TIFTF001_016794 [Ficus carica]
MATTLGWDRSYVSEFGCAISVSIARFISVSDDNDLLLRAPSVSRRHC